MLLRTGIHHWTIAPLQFTNCEIKACFLECAWWFKWRKWALNACAPAIPSDTDSTAPPPQHTKRLGTVLRRLHSARIDRDYAQIHFLQKEVSAISSGLNIPYVPAPVVKVPDLTGEQKGAVSAAVRSMVKGMSVPRWQRQAVQASIRVVRTVPHTLRKIVEKHQSKAPWDTDRPDCCCTAQHLPIWEALGQVRTIDGHFALLLVTLQHQGAIVRSGDPIPQHGQKSRADCISDLERVASALHTQIPRPDKTIPRVMFSESGGTLRSIRKSVDLLSSVAYVRIVDKHSSAMWAFCKQWAWDQHVKFVSDEGYTRITQTPDEVKKRLKKRVSAGGWKPGVSARVSLMYLLGKAKAMRKETMLWRPMAAASRPFVSRHTLRIAARAFTCFLRLLRESVTASILVLRVSDVAPWVRTLSQWGATCVHEADCKEQFNRIRPNVTVRELREASQFLYHKKRWGAEAIVWSIHRDCKELDRAGRAASSAFWHFSHEELTQLVQFSLTEDNQVWCAGAMWKRANAIPMGGSFSAQCADLHSLWALKQGVDVMRRFGTLIKEAPFPVWETPAGNTVSLSQSRDNVNVGAKGPSACDEMSRVCHALAQCWDLPVHCDCLSRGDECDGSCMSDKLRILGVTIHVGSSVLCFSTPSALSDTWSLKWGPSLHSPWAVSMGHLSNIFTGSLVNSLPFNFSWACLLLSVSAWMQLAVLCDHGTSTVLRAMKGVQ